MFVTPKKIDRHTFSAGYGVISNLLTSEGIVAFKAELDFLIKNCEPKWLKRNSKTTADGSFLVIRSIDTPSDIFFSAGRSQILIDLAEIFARKSVTPLYSEYFNKPPFSNCCTPVHQDHAFYNEHFPDELGVTFWVPLEDCDEENGCMHVAPSVRGKLFEHVSSNALGFAYEMSDQNTHGFSAIRLRAGDALLHDSYTPHYCPPNRSSRGRPAIAISFRTSDYREQMWKHRR